MASQPFTKLLRFWIKPNKMKTLLLLSLFVSTFGFSQTLSQYFDGADTLAYQAIMIEIDSGSVWQIGPPDKEVHFKSASTIPNVIVTDTINPYPVNDTSSFRISILNEWGNWGILAMEWNQKLDLDSLSDWGVVEFSLDNGASWMNAFDNPYVYNFYGYNPMNVDYMPSGYQGFTDQDTLWKNIWLCFDLSWMSQVNDSVDFRYTIISDSVQTKKEGWMIDNMLAHYTWVHTLPEIKQDEYMKVFPNPTDGRVYIKAKKQNGFHIIETMDLMDESGRVVESWRNVPTQFFIDLDNHPNGLYHLKVRTNIQEDEFKILLNK